MTRLYVEALKNFKFNPEEIYVDLNQNTIEYEGEWWEKTLYETLVLTTLTWVYADYHGLTKQSQIDALTQTVDFLREYSKTPESKEGLIPFSISEMGTRRRASFHHQALVIDLIRRFDPQLMPGTSNVHLAKYFDITPVGTYPHEWLMAYQVLSPIKAFQKSANIDWGMYYYSKGCKLLALGDVFGQEAFLAELDRDVMAFYEGTRWDSGDPKDFYKTLEHYKALGIPTETCEVKFTDGLNVKTAVNLYKEYGKIINTSFGIGTFLTFNGNVPAPSFVIKLHAINGYPVAKLSDQPAKDCGDPICLPYYRKVKEVKESEYHRFNRRTALST